MTYLDVYKAFYTYVSTVVSPIVVVMAFQSTPQPSAPFIALATPSAMPESQPMHRFDALSASSFSETARTEYAGSISMWAVSAAGLADPTDILRPVVSSYGLQTWVDYFASKGVAIRTADGPRDVPTLSGQEYEPEAVLTFNLAFADEVTAAIAAINTVEVTLTP